MAYTVVVWNILSLFDYSSCVAYTSVMWPILLLYGIYTDVVWYILSLFGLYSSVYPIVLLCGIYCPCFAFSVAV